MIEISRLARRLIAIWMARKSSENSVHDRHTLMGSVNGDYP